MRADRRVLHRPPLTDPAIRPGRDDDAPGIIALIARCWADYPGVVLHVDQEAPELRALATHYARLGGALWVTEGHHGMAAAKPARPGVWEICRLYVHPDHHGLGLGHVLLDVAEAHAAARGATTLELWSDTRFHRAHRFYEKRGYVRGACRDLNDLCHSTEHQFSRINPTRPAPACR